MSTSTLTLDEQHAIRGADGWYPWKPGGADQPKTIPGDVVALDSVWSDYANEFRVLAVIREDDGTMWEVRTYPTRLHDEWLRVRPQIGERVSLRFVGMLERKKDGKPYPDVSVAVERETAPTFDYARVVGESESEPSAALNRPAPVDGDPGPEPPADDESLPF